jgi:NAD-dependent dihydropyrimidine dehydrogenase PreA subunit
MIPAAHAWRWHGLYEALAWIAPLPFLLTRRDFVRRACQAVMLAGVLVTLDSMVHFIAARQALDAPWHRLAMIISLASLLPALAAWALEHPLFSKSAPPRPAASTGTARTIPASPSPSAPWPALAACALAFFGLAMVQLKVPTPMLLAERFLSGAGWLQAVLLALYAGFVAEALLTPGRSPVVRGRIWGFFSLVFFGQLALGLAGFERFLMTGKLHLPVPALIVAGPLFRGEGLFMLILYGVTVLLAGPAWCSHLCYIGAWDSALARAKKRPGPLPAWARRGRMILAGTVFAAAWIMGRLGVPAGWAVALAAGFGLTGVGVMIGISRRSGVMAHCAGFCPMGLVSGVLGRLSPWRLRIREGCTACGVCSRACRYDALRPSDLAARRPGVSCSLCGDCLSSCPRSEMELTLFGRARLAGVPARAVFVAMVAGLHAVFLGVARL